MRETDRQTHKTQTGGHKRNSSVLGQVQICSKRGRCAADRRGVVVKVVGHAGCARRPEPIGRLGGSAFTAGAAHRRQPRQYHATTTTSADPNKSSRNIIIHLLLLRRRTSSPQQPPGGPFPLPASAARRFSPLAFLFSASSKIG
ncbi:unnamed protein product [Nesidiocoris tenuis]|uniref:Uncharacterized protein n=1 Tax=Nesidiocoris tenuis TaxID=355587 RepID=A0A6H5GH69_9HEMI|nr:unnamed protein product [Nesidiocoris tenuis]